LGLVAAAQALGQVLGDPLAASARRAQWRVDRAYRQALDARTLVHYLPQPEVEEALEQLVRGRGGWAVHLLGDGGVGKTMALRDLVAGQFADRLGRSRFPVARIDFDHLDPRYPERRPVELLIALAGELAGFTTSRDAHHGMRQFDSAAAHLHEVLAAPVGAQGGDMPVDGTAEAGLLTTAVDAFAAFVDELDGPVVLVLDTCEELAKLHAPGGRAPAIDRTFEILERIRTRTSEVRVVFAGRRWLTPPPAGPSRPNGIELSPRPYLSVVSLGGFTAGMAERYLDRRDPHRVMPPELRGALLDRCLPPGTSTANPFDLACYADWAMAEPDVDPDRLRSTPGDPYVEQRIIGRLTDTSVRDCLGVAVELGRFEAAMIEPALSRRGIDTGAAFSGLVGQEWVSAVSFDTDGRPKVIEISEHLRPRLRRVVAADSDRFPLERVPLGRDLAALIAGRQVEQASVEAIEGALRLLPPSEAAAMWADLEEQVAQSDAWGWAAQVVPRVAATEAERAAAGGPTVLAAVRATQAAATLRQPRQPGLRGLWDEVGRLAPRHPNPIAAETLAARAICGHLVAAGHVGLGVTWSQQLHEVLPLLPPGSMVAALDALTASGAPLDSNLADVLDELCEREDAGSDVAAAALLVRASSHLARGDADNAVTDVETSMGVIGGGAPEPEAPAPGSGISRRVWADWVVAPRLLDRARLARVVLASIRGEAPVALPIATWRHEAMNHLADIDSERLLAATISLELDWRLVDAVVLEAAAEAEVYVDKRQPTHHWHHRIEPLRMVLCRGAAARGDLAVAVRALRDRREAAVRFGEDPLTISACEAVLVDMCRSFRTTKLTSSIPRLARRGTLALRAEAWATLALVAGESPATPEEAGGRHAWWQAQIRRAGSPPVRWPGMESEALDDEGVPALVAWADAVEAKTIAGSRSRGSDGPVYDALRPATLILRRGRDQLTGDVVGAALRAAVITGRLDDVEVEALPPRWAALVALGEGELLALRLPQAGAALLALAERLFVVAGDAASCARARVLQVLAVSRAGGVPATVSLPERSSLDLAVTGDDDGWAVRVRLAESLRAGRPLKFMVDERSPELDPRPLDPEQRAATSVPDQAAVSLEAAPRSGPDDPRGAEAAVETDYRYDAAPPVAAPTGAAQARRSRMWLLLGGVVLVMTTLATLAVTQLLNAHSAIALVPIGLVLLLLTLIGVGRGLSRGYRMLDESEAIQEASHTGLIRRRYIQRTVGVDLSRPAAKLFPVRVTPTASGLLFERQTTPVEVTSPDRPLGLPVLADLPARLFWSRRQYVVVPLLTTSEDDSQAWEQDLGASDPRLAGRRPLWIRLSESGWRAGVSIWLLGATDHPQWNHAGVLFRGPRALDPQLSAAAKGSTSQVVLAALRRLLRSPDVRHPESPSQVVLAALRRLLRSADVRHPESPSQEVLAVLHLVGTPVPTAAGWRIRVAGAGPHPEAMKQTRGTLEGEQLLGPDELRAERTALAVLQAEPVDGPPRPLGDLRQGMCALASELRAAGAGAVLVVPPLPDSLSSRVVAEVSRIMTRNQDRMHPTRVLDLVDHLRGLIRTGPEVAEPASSAGAQVAALDLLLFV
jgi:hypothetical protein